MSSRRYLAGSQRRRRGRTALVRSWHSALDNQRTEGRAILILGSASAVEHRRERELCLATTRIRCTSDGSRVQPSTLVGSAQLCISIIFVCCKLFFVSEFVLYKYCRDLQSRTKGTGSKTVHQLSSLNFCFLLDKRRGWCILLIPNLA